MITGKKNVTFFIFASLVFCAAFFVHAGFVSADTACVPNWVCDWRACINGVQNMGVIDANNCGLALDQMVICPALARVCTSLPVTSPAQDGGGNSYPAGLLPYNLAPGAPAQSDIGFFYTPSILDLSAPGAVAYLYTVWDNNDKRPLSNVQIVDNGCAPVTYLSGDDNNNNLLEAGEDWNFGCAKTISQTTLSTAMVTAHNNVSYHQSDLHMAIGVTIVAVGASVSNPFGGELQAPHHNHIEVFKQQIVNFIGDFLNFLKTGF
jgi:hypothetical protein